MFVHQERDIVVMVHGDVDSEDLRWLASMLKEKLGITTDIIGHDGDSQQQLKVLNRFISVKDGGYTYESDVRHSEMIVKEHGARCKDTEHTSVRHAPRERKAVGSQEVQEVSVHVRSSELPGHRQN